MALRDLTARIRITADTRGVRRGLNDAQRSVSSFGAVFGKISLGIVAAVGAVTAAFASLRKGLTLEAQETALRIQLSNIGQDFDSFIAELQRVAEGTLSTSQAIQASSQALLLGIPAEQISELLEVARKSAQATGQSISDAFRDIATGIGRASPLILDNLGIVVKLGDANTRYAEALGKTVEELTAAERKQALLNEVLRTSETSFAGLENAISPTATALDRLVATVTDAFDSFTKFIGRSERLAGVLNLLTESLEQVFLALRALGFQFGILNVETLLAEERQKRLAIEAGKLAQAEREAAAAEADAAREAAKLAVEAEKAADAVEKEKEQAQAAAPANRELALELDAANDEYERQAFSADQATRAVAASGQQALITAQQFRELARAQGEAAAVEAALASGATVSRRGNILTEGGVVTVQGGSRGLRRILAGNGQFGSTGQQSRYFENLGTYR